MADINNKLRLQIVTQLDAAGIKATKEQVDQLELGLRRAGNSGKDTGEKFGKLEKALGNLPGPIGKIGNALGGLAGQATMVFGAFSYGVEIGNKIVEQLRSWGAIADPIKELKKENRAYAEELKNVKEALVEVEKEEAKRWQQSSEAADKAIKRIDDQTAAYFRQVQALSGLKKAEGNAEMMQLERAKFEDMRSLTEQGSPEAAEQIGKYYDVLIAELAAKQQLAQFDRESVRLTKELSSAEEAHQLAAEEAARAKARQADAEARLANFRATRSAGGGGAYLNAADAERDDMLERIAEKAKRDAEKAEAALDKRSQRLENVDAEMLTRQMERANLAVSGTLGVDRAAAAYDDYIRAVGNPLNASVDESWAKDIAKNSLDAYNVQKAVLEEVKQFGDRLERLLEVK